MPSNTCLEPPFTTAGHPSQCPARAIWQLFLAWLQGLQPVWGIPQTSALACVFRDPETVWSEAERQHENLLLAPPVPVLCITYPKAEPPPSFSVGRRAQGPSPSLSLPIHPHPTPPGLCGGGLRFGRLSLRPFGVLCLSSREPPSEQGHRDPGAASPPLPSQSGAAAQWRS